MSAACTSKTDTAGTVQKVRVETVVSEAGGGNALYPGKVKAAEDVSLAFRVSGTIERYCVEEGAHVSKGQLLVELDPTDYQVQLDATEAEYKQVKAEAERIMSLYADSVATPNDNDRAVYGLQQISAKLKNHRDQLSYTKLYAPFNGTIQKHLLDAHETVGAGTPVISMISGGALEVEINIPAADYTERSSFSGYHCTFTVYPGEVYDMSLISVTPKANSNELYTMRLQLNTAGKPAPSPGMNAMVTIERKSTSANDSIGTGKYKVSASAVTQKDGRCTVFVYDAASGTVSSHEVAMREVRHDGSCIIESTELNAGDVIVASGARHVSDGEKVEVITETTDTNVGGLL